MSKRLNNLLLLHGIVIIFGFTGIWGKLISLDAIPLVWYRITLALPFLLLIVILFSKKDLRVTKNTLSQMAVGMVIAIHWIAFFAAIKASNVSIALAVMASTAFFTSILDPLIFKKPFVWYEIILSIATIIGLAIIFSFEFRFIIGILLALVSAFLAALFTVLNGQLVKQHHPYVITFWEMVGGFIIVSIYLLATIEITPEFFFLSASDWYYLLLLSLLATVIGFIINVQVMKELSPFTVALTVNLEPVYAIILAWIYFGEGERMTGQFYLGTAVILGTIFLNTWLKGKFSNPDV